MTTAKNVASSTSIKLATVKNEPRIDSRYISESLQVSHKSNMQLINQYSTQLKTLASLPFEKEARKRSHGGVRVIYALLNEDQAYFLLTLSKNTERAVQLKLNLVKAFSQARNQQKINDEYLPFYHEMHDVIKMVAEKAKSSGSQTTEKIFHINFNKMINQMLGISAGERNTLTAHEKLFLTNLNAIALHEIEKRLLTGMNHKQIYQEVKLQLTIHSTTLRQSLLQASSR
jgi:phage regulator Rha-like protein